MTGMTIGKVARQSGVNIETLRYYERRGLVDPPPRTPSNYRLYPPGTVRRVRFIKRAQELGFSLSEINELLSLKNRPDTRCADIRQRAEAKIASINNKIDTLLAMRGALATLMATCEDDGPLDDCPILTALDGEGGT